MIPEQIVIKRFKSANISEYKNILSTHYKPHELSVIASLYFKHNKTLFLMTRHYETKFLFWKVDHDDIIGYCIIEDIREFKPDEREYMAALYSVPLDVLEEYPTVISDFMIAAEHRRKGYGTKMVEYIITNYYPDDNISLHAVQDGIYFWDKLGFEYVDGLDSVMIRTGGDKQCEK